MKRVPKPSARMLAIQPQPMTSEQIADLVQHTKLADEGAVRRGGISDAARVRALRTRALTVSDLDSMQEVAGRYSRLTAKHPKRGTGRAGSPSTLSDRARAIIERTRAARSQ